MKRKNLFPVLISGSLLLLAFQNCAKAQFQASPAGALVVSQNPQAGSDGFPVLDGDVNHVETDDQAKHNDSVVEQPPAAKGPVSPGPVAGPAPQPSKEPCKDAKEPTKEETSHDGDEKNVEGSHSFVCVLDGPGESLKLAYSEAGNLEGKTGTPQDICMSEHACLKIVSAKFPVKMAAERGFCPDKNPHVVEMSDEQIQNLVNKVSH